MSQLIIKVSACKVAIDSLPVLIDIDWLGCTMTRPDAGIIPSREASTADRKLAQIRSDADDTVIL